MVFYYNYFILLHSSTILQKDILVEKYILTFLNDKNLDINFLIIILESCSVEFCGAPLKSPIDLALSKVGNIQNTQFQKFLKKQYIFFHKVHLTKVEAKVEAQLSKKY